MDRIYKSSMAFCLIVICFLMMNGCESKPDIDVNKSTLLDTLHINFTGYLDHDEIPSNARYLGDGNMLIMGIRSPIDKQADKKVSNLLILSGENGDISWMKVFDNIFPKDAVSLNQSHFMVLFDSTVEKGDEKEIFNIVKIMNLKQEIIESRVLPFKLNSRAQQLVKIDDGSLYALAMNDVQDTINFHPEILHFDISGTELENNWDFNLNKIIEFKNGTYIGVRSYKNARKGIEKIFCFNEAGEILWEAGEIAEKSNAIISGATLDKDGNYLLSGFDYSIYRAMIAKYSPTGEFLWIKSPIEMNKYLTYNLIPWNDNTFLVAAQKSLTENKLITSTFWESLAAFIIDGEGNVLESDVRPQYWTLTIGGVYETNIGAIFIGLGGVDRETYLKQRDIAIYSLHKERIRH